MSRSETELGGYKEIVFRVAGDRVYSRLKFESGVHRVQRVPETESQGRVHTSTTTVAVLPEAEELDFYIDPKDLRIDTFRASGAGGYEVYRECEVVREQPTEISELIIEYIDRHRNITVDKTKWLEIVY